MDPMTQTSQTPDKLHDYLLEMVQQLGGLHVHLVPVIPDGNFWQDRTSVWMNKETWEAVKREARRRNAEETPRLDCVDLPGLQLSNAAVLRETCGPVDQRTLPEPPLPTGGVRLDAIEGYFAINGLQVVSGHMTHEEGKTSKVDMVVVDGEGRRYDLTLPFRTRISREGN